MCVGNASPESGRQREPPRQWEPASTDTRGQLRRQGKRQTTGHKKRTDRTTEEGNRSKKRQEDKRRVHIKKQDGEQRVRQLRGHQKWRSHTSEGTEIILAQSTDMIWAQKKHPVEVLGLPVRQNNLGAERAASGGPRLPSALK